jgi:mRNA-degrading endonuclease toxin of MazEF toxin-antitoxin module
MPKDCVVNLDSIATIAKASLIERITALRPQKMRAVEAAIRFALALELP